MVTSRVILIVGLAFCCQNVKASLLCTTEELKDKFTAHIDDFYATTKEELDSMCSEYIPTTNGVVDYIRQCRDTEIGTRLRFYEIIKETLNELCNPNNDLHRMYLENIECLKGKKSSRIGTSCISTVMPNDLEDGDACSNGFLYYGCAYRDVREKCGSDALYVAKEIDRHHLESVRRKCCEETKA